MRYEREVVWKLSGDTERAQRYLGEARVAIGTLLNANVQELQQVSSRTQLDKGVYCIATSIPGAIICEVYATTSEIGTDGRVAGFMVRASDGQEGVIAWSPEVGQWRWLPKSRFTSGLTVTTITWKNKEHAYSVGIADERHALWAYVMFNLFGDTHVYKDGMVLCSSPGGRLVYGAAQHDSDLVIVTADYAGANIQIDRARYPYTTWSSYSVEHIGRIQSPALFNEDGDAASYIAQYDSDLYAVTVSLSGSVISSTQDSNTVTQNRSDGASHSSSSSHEFDPGHGWVCENGGMTQTGYAYEMPSCANYWAVSILEWQYQPLSYRTLPGRSHAPWDGVTTPPPGSTSGAIPWFGSCVEVISPPEQDTAESVYRPEIWSVCGGTACTYYTDWIGTATESTQGEVRSTGGSWSKTSNHSAGGTSGNWLIATEDGAVVRARQDAISFSSSNSCSADYSQTNDNGSLRQEIEVPSHMENRMLCDSATWNPNNAVPMFVADFPIIQYECDTYRTQTYQQNMEHQSSVVQEMMIDSIGLPIEMLAQGTYYGSHTAWTTESSDSVRNCWYPWDSISYSDSENTCWFSVWDADATTRFPLGFDMRCGALLYIETTRVSRGSTEQGNESSVYEGRSFVRLRLPDGTLRTLQELDFPVCFVGVDANSTDAGCNPYFNRVGEYGVVCRDIVYSNDPMYDTTGSSSYTEEYPAAGARALFSRWLNFMPGDAPYLTGGLISRERFGAEADIRRDQVVFQCNQDIFGHWMISVRVAIQQFSGSWPFVTLVGPPIYVTYSSLDDYDEDPTDIMNVAGENPCFEKIGVVGWRNF